MYNMDKRHLQMVLTLLLVGSVNACSNGGGSLPATTRPLSGPVLAPSTLPLRAMSVTNNIQGTSIAIDAGGGAVGNFVADTDYSSVGVAGVHAVTNAINTSRVSNPAPQSVYQTQRYATHLTYAIPNLLPGANYNVKLDFVESFFSGPLKRVFNAKINGVQVLTNFDIFAAAGGANIAIAPQVVSVADATGKITIVLDATVNNATISGIEIVPIGSPTPTPAPSLTPVIAIDAGGGAAPGNWIADADYQISGWGGAATTTSPITTNLVSHPAPQSVYQSQRWAPSITYAIPRLLPNAAYTVRLHFVESYWSARGQRVFNVAINNAAVLTNFDIFSSAGGLNSAIVKEFPVNADGSGVITIKFNATVDRATIAGIEVLGGFGNPSPSPSPSPSVSPSPTGDKLPQEFAQVFNSSSPLRTKLANMPYKTVQAPLSSSIWNQQNFTSTQQVTTAIPVYVSSNPSDPLITVAPCTLYGGGCSMAGKQIHINRSDNVQSCSWSSPGNYCDGHLLLIDTSENIEIDCWGARDGGGQQNSTPPYTVDLSNNQLVCAWGGWYPLSSTGLNGIYSNENNPNNGSGIAFGPAAALFMITPSELLNGHINHALALNAVCMDAPSVYPSDYNGTDKTCDGGSNFPHYGDAIMYVGQTDAQIAASSRSTPCKAVLTAMHDYGAYFSDTGDSVTVLDVQSAEPYHADPGEMGSDPYPAVYAELQAAGDGDGSGSWQNCMNGLSNNSFNLIELTHP